MFVQTTSALCFQLILCCTCSASALHYIGTTAFVVPLLGALFMVRFTHLKKLFSAFMLQDHNSDFLPYNAMLVYSTACDMMESLGHASIKMACPVSVLSSFRLHRQPKHLLAFICAELGTRYVPV